MTESANPVPVEPASDRSLLRRLMSLPARSVILLIEGYRSYISPLRLPTCRFTPTCSEYAVEALRTRGFVVGAVLAVVRLLKCAPWHPGGWDPVPPPRRLRGGADAVPTDTDHACPQSRDPVRVNQQRST
ncbi:membrane protein insertion efficiency factor YidD [Rhodococcus sp. BP-149]|nr:MULTISPECIES: membrane protein insertion efficiency factor YidD [unclassified Rhodococcus (in: high G+C Gram-positive bacteria)]MBY6687922.1 membrane protein insertion efficiency factor YidD [Rhodococcus sp. BP-288]MBY6696375.1 membrane protein insertion efficiency factor YidD [Rhodococcus sp. BP-188]MBY6700856.1 membrane protein insertion efficiency factor YidD [Rhodococcus sp. BP-285]MBY6701623.1 membrane protein insertion efficiency factor YidD [Rhodococcus sp. BP-283]MBY6712624.1 membra